MPQKQDLQLFSDHSIISSQILSSNFHPSTIQVTSVEATQPTWLVTNILELLLFGKSKLNPTQVSSDCAVYVISFLKPASHYSYYFKKSTGKELNQPRYHFIDCFSGLFDKLLKGDVSSKSVKRLFDTHISSKIEKSNSTVLLFEYPEFLLSSTDLLSSELLKCIHSLQVSKTAQLTVISSSADTVDFTREDDSIEAKTTHFLSSIYTRSNVVVSLRPLSTGRADDVSGSIRISRGPIPFESYDSSKLQVSENEYLFLVNRDNSASLFFR